MTLTPKGYRPRLIESQVQEMLDLYGAVCIEGPRACGKTWTAKNHSASAFELNDPRGNFANLRRAESDIMCVFEGESPHLVDEWQTVPEIWDATKYLVDSRAEPGRYILTGSSTPQIKGIHHDGTGRIGFVRMRPMSLYESGDSSGTVSLSSLFADSMKATEVIRPDLEHLVELTMRGGWPSIIGKKPSQHARYSKDYIESTIRSAERLDGIARNGSKIRMLIRSLARNEGTQASNNTLVRDMTDCDEHDVQTKERAVLSAHSLPDYNDVLERLYFVDNQPSFDFNCRAPIRVGKKAKRRLADPSLSIAALGISKNSLVEDRETYGFMFESMCIRDLRIYAESHGGEVFHYRDDSGMEVDAIVQMPDGRYGAIEIKLGEGQADIAARGLKRFQAYTEKNELPEPSFSCILCGECATAYTREDGIHVVPLLQLRDRGQKLPPLALNSGSFFSISGFFILMLDFA